jgi:hypothetical protein
MLPKVNPAMKTATSKSAVEILLPCLRRNSIPYSTLHERIIKSTIPALRINLAGIWQKM